MPFGDFQVSGTLKRGGGGALVDVGANQIINLTDVTITRVALTMPNLPLTIEFIDDFKPPGIGALFASDRIEGQFFPSPFSSGNSVKYQGFVNTIIPIGAVFNVPLAGGNFGYTPPHTILLNQRVNQLKGVLTLDMKFIGDKVKLLNSAEVGIEVVPEPTSTLSLLALGTLGAASTLKRKLKPSKPSEKETTTVS
jgi:hypothetical protein